MSLFKHKNLLIIFIMLALSVLAVYSAHAAAPLGLTQTLTLNFGTVVKPTSGRDRVVVRKNGTLGAATTAFMLDTASISEGRHNITGSGGSNSIGISFSDCASNAALGLRLRNFKARYNNQINFKNSATGLDAPGQNPGKEVKYGATLVVWSNATTGVLSPCYNVEVNYD